MEIEATKKAVSADALSVSLTTFDDLYQEATPDEISLSLLDGVRRNGVTRGTFW
jgi:hypothetical protein